MTDIDIIKVGECIRGEKVLCLSCPYRARFPDCRKYAIRDISDLASRQKAELQRLEKQKYEDDETIIKLNHELLTVVVAAVKEFAERLKLEAYYECTITGYKYQVVQIEDIDNLLKEYFG